MHLAAVQVTDTAADVAAAAAGSARAGRPPDGDADRHAADRRGRGGRIGADPGEPDARHHGRRVRHRRARSPRQESALHQLDAVIGTITLSDGTTTTAATAASLAPLDSHFGLGVQLLVHDTAAGIVAAARG